MANDSHSLAALELRINCDDVSSLVAKFLPVVAIPDLLLNILLNLRAIKEALH